MYKIVGKDITKYRKIIGNEYLCVNEYLGLKLHRQDYSDGTCFYTLQDKFGEFRVNHGSKNLEKLIDVLERENQLDEKYIKSFPAIKETITQRNIFIIDIKKIL